MSLFLKYRPSDFTNLVGQSFVKETLQKAIENDKTVGAYLLCGPRGTGKTSTARIFAKAINCENPINGNPCLKCSICTDFALEKLIDIIEIDAASHTGVDNIREIIEKAQFSPTKTKFKIYIIDEVHMLSKGAFNALLKILEEPPKHVKFILATTETHKVPETIISRCQRYDFKRISDQDIKERLGFIAKSEDIKTDEKSIEYIIKNSSGGLRNAISLFEQLIFDGEINYEKIVDKLEIVDENEINLFLEKLVNSDKSVINIIEKNISDGKNIKLFFKELLFYTKNKSLEILKNGGDISKYIKILDILDETYSKTKNSLDENITFTIGVLKILNGYTEQQVIVEKNNNPILNSFPLQEKEATKTIEKKEKVKEEISHEDVGDIFGEELVKEEIKKAEATPVGGSFNTVNFINKLKENGAKGGLTIIFKLAKVNINGNDFTISIGNKMQITTIDNNINIIKKSLEDLGFNNLNIIAN